ncbi:MAG: 4Fe-4S binding protein [Campylobacteraceae bacterium]|jgi:2-oxoacid:acceptor oxidoreductase delta subunit (pyruvate/2-ketoisovalerate family)|nr:4Fe-4S binding protein [Campylobacteraceae bacterium]
MKKPKLYAYTEPVSIDGYPQSPCFQAGHLVSANKSYRVLKPVIDEDKCIGCILCYALCPDGAIFRFENIVKVDYDFCKGCGICANECKSNVIKMVEES